MFIVGGNQSAGGYNVDNSVRINRGDQDSMSGVTNGTSTNQNKYTVSFWTKRARLSNGNTLNIMEGYTGNSDTGTGSIFWRTTEALVIGGYSTNWRITDRLFRDVSAWYHIVFSVDTTQATADDRVKVYVNGVEETEFSTKNNPSQNSNTGLNNNSAALNLFRRVLGGSNDNHGDGYFSEFCFIDGSALDPTSFGEFDEDSGIWKPIDVSGLSFGTNGFYLQFKDSSALGDDTSGNSNDFTVNNITSIDQTTDTCTNNYSTYNPLYTVGSVDPTFSNGNCTSASPTTGGTAPVSTFAIPKSGKWFWEVKIDSASSISDHVRIGINIPLESNPSNPTYGVRYLSNGNKNVDGSSSSYGASYAQGDIIGVAVDSDGDTVEFYKNGSSQGSISYTQQSDDYFAVTCEASNTLGFTFSINFGNPPFSISSGNSDGNGYGNFEYSVPSGYHALNTKNLAEYG